MVATKDYEFVTARQEGTLVLIQPEVENNTLVLSAPGMTQKLKLPVFTEEAESVQTK